MMDDYSLPASMLRQWAYCPRIPFFRETLGINPAMPGWTKQGVDFDALQHVLSRDRRFRRLHTGGYKHSRKVHLRDPSLQLHGIADLLLIGTDQLYVCDFKLDAERVTRGTRLQLAAYAVMAEKQYTLPCSGLVVITDKPMRLLLAPWNEQTRHELIDTLDTVKRQLGTGLMPDSGAGPEKCGICEYLNYCNDRM